MHFWEMVNDKLAANCHSFLRLCVLHFIEQFEHRQAKSIRYDLHCIQGGVCIIEFTESVIGEVGDLLPDDFPMDVAEAVFSGMRRQSAKLATLR